MSWKNERRGKISRAAEPAVTCPFLCDHFVEERRAVHLVAERREPSGEPQARLEITMDLRDLRAFSPPLPEYRARGARSKDVGETPMPLPKLQSAPHILVLG